MSDSKLNDAFSAAVRMYRKSKSMSAEECARELGIGRTSLLNIENRQANPTLDTVETVAHSIGCDPVSMLGGMDKAEFATALLLMNCLENGHRFSLETLKSAADLLQAAVRILYEEQRDEDCSETVQAERDQEK